MTGELRKLHDRLGATTIYVTHDQLEAMAMADRVAVMNQGVVEQIGSPSEIYDRPASLFVADFIGSPPMNLLGFRGAAQAGATEIRLGDALVAAPRLEETLSARDLVLGVRPEAVLFDDASALRGGVFAVEYLGTTQIVTLTTDFGLLRARTSAQTSVRVGERLGLRFRPEKLSLFDKTTGRALRSALHDGAAHV
jgi:multiple sugar transport system ATP-binding protein